MKPFAIVVSCLSALAVTALVFSTAYWVRPFFPANEPLLIAKATAPEGTTAYLTQTYRGLLELYDVHFYTRDRKGIWRKYYVEHEDTFWSSGSLWIDAQRKTIFICRGSRPMARFDWGRNNYRLERDKPAEAALDFRLLEHSTEPPLFAPN